MNRVIIYIIGALLVVGGLAYAAHLVGINNTWIVLGSLIIVGIAIMSAATKARGTSNTKVDVHDNG